MRKRLISLLLCLALLISVVPFGADAAAQDEQARILKQMSRSYRLALYNTGRDSLSGVCGLMTGYLLWLLDVTDYPEVYDGRDFFDAYSKKTYTSNGNRVQIYSAKDYDLEEALNAATHFGTKDIYNIMVGFQWTNTKAGNRYGHAMVIQAILDGQVYFVEGFYTSLSGMAGNPIVCSIKEFADYYNDWCRFEGIAVCGKRDYTDYCQSYSADMFIRTLTDVPLYSQPCMELENGCTVLRTVSAGEHLFVNEICENPDGGIYYRICEGETAGYVSAASAALLQNNPEAVTVSDLTMPTVLDAGQAFPVTGTVTAKNSRLRRVELVVADENGGTVLSASGIDAGCSFDLSKLSKELEFGALAVGGYTLKLYAEVDNHTVSEGGVVLQSERLLADSAAFQVGDVGYPVVSPETETGAPEEASEGWVYENGSWYFYQNGAPRTGWFCHEGVDYYFLEDGSAATGWLEVNGRWRCFTDCGAMRTGWVQTDDGVYYMLSNGVAALGWRTIGGAEYCFGTDGRMLTDCQVQRDGVTYYLLSDGVASATAAEAAQ